MLPLDSPIWEELTGGYKTNYNAAEKLVELRNTDDSERYQ